MLLVNRLQALYVSLGCPIFNLGNKSLFIIWFVLHLGLTCNTLWKIWPNNGILLCKVLIPKLSIMNYFLFFLNSWFFYYQKLHTLIKLFFFPLFVFVTIEFLFCFFFLHFRKFDKMLWINLLVPSKRKYHLIVRFHFIHFQSLKCLTIRYLLILISLNFLLSQTTNFD